MRDGGAMTIEDVMTRHGMAIRAGDVDGVLADYVEDSVIMSPGRTARGLAEIRDLFTDLFTNLIPPGSSKLEATWSAMDGDYVFVVWKGESEGHTFPIGTDTFVVRDDKIVFQTFVAHAVDQ
jgi:ketosteroid isomerase-like protein